MTKDTAKTDADDKGTADEATAIEAVGEYLADVTMTPVVRFVEIADGIFVNADNVTHVDEADGAAVVHFIGGRSTAIADCRAADVVAGLTTE